MKTENFSAIPLFHSACVARSSFKNRSMVFYQLRHEHLHTALLISASALIPALFKGFAVHSGSLVSTGSTFIIH